MLSVLVGCRLWFQSVASGPCLAIRSRESSRREASRNDDTGLASIDRRIRGHIAADHDIDQPDVRQISGQEVQYFARDGPFAPVEVFGRSTLLVTPQ
jgi:hypothetical protein